MAYREGVSAQSGVAVLLALLGPAIRWRASPRRSGSAWLWARRQPAHCGAYCSTRSASPVQGTVAGVLLSLAGARLLEGFVAGVQTRDVPTLIIVGLSFLSAAMLAAVGPARRASAVAPGVSMRDS